MAVRYGMLALLASLLMASSGCSLWQGSVSSGSLASHFSIKKDKRFVNILTRPIDQHTAQQGLQVFHSEIEDAETRGERKKAIKDLRRYVRSISVPVALAENPPDVALGRDIDSTSSVVAKLTQAQLAEISPTVVFNYEEKLLEQATLAEYNYALRDSLYRLNEALFIRPDLVSNAEYQEMFQSILHLIVESSPAKIAAATAAERTLAGDDPADSVKRVDETESDKDPKPTPDTPDKPV